MPEVRPRQTSFAGGELAKGMRGRVGHPVYRVGARSILNWFIGPNGSLLNRPGSIHIDWIVPDLQPLLGSTSNTGRSWPITRGTEGTPTAQAVRIQAFEFAAGEACILCWMNTATKTIVRFYRYDATVGHVVPVNNGSNGYLQREAPYTSDLRKLRFSQVADVIKVTGTEGTGIRPYEIRRLEADSSNWELEQIDFSVPLFPDYGGYPVLTETTGATSPKARWEWMVTRVLEYADGSVRETRGRLITFSPNVAIERYNDQTKYFEGLLNNFVTIESSTDYVYRCIKDNGPGNGGVHEPEADGNDWWEEVDWSDFVNTIRIFNTAPNAISLSVEEPVYLNWPQLPTDEESQPDPDGEPRIIQTNVYRGQEGRFGFVGFTRSDFFIDTGSAPNFQIQPPQGNNPFQLTANSAVDGPRAITIHEGRLILGGTPLRPGRFWGSAVSQYTNFDIFTGAPDAAAFTFELASTQYEEIRAMLSMRVGLLVFTSHAEWLVAGSGQMSIVTPNSISARTISRNGCGDLGILEVGDLIVYAQRKGTVPRIIVPSGDSMVTIQAARYARHLFKGKTLRDWAYQEDPDPVIWSPRSDGVLLSGTYEEGNNFAGWCRHEIAGGALVQSVTTLTEGNEDSVYMAVTRPTDGNSNVRHFHLEKFASRDIEDVRDAVFVDGCLTYDGRNTSSATVTVTSGASQDENTTCTVAISGDAGSYVDEYLRVHGVDEDGKAVTTLVHLTAHTGGGSYTATLKEYLPDGIDGTATTSWSVTRNSMTDLGQINAQTVVGLADGEVIGPFTVANDTVVLDYHAEVFCIGVGYNCDLEMLPAPPDRSRDKAVSHVVLETYGARGGFAGSTFSNLERITDRQVSSDYGPQPLTDRAVKVPISSKYGTDAPAVVRQSDPLPIEITAVQRIAEVTR